MSDVIKLLPDSVANQIAAGEVCIKCSWQWTQRNGVNGQLVTGPNGNTMFLPATGYYYGSKSSLKEVGSSGACWTRTINLDDAPNARCMFWGDWGDRQGNDKENGIKVERTVISPRYMADDDEAAKFVGVKVGDTFTFNPHKAYNGNTAELSGLLNVDRADADVKSDFRITIEEIKVNKDAEMNEEFFKGVLGTETDVKDEAAFREAMRDMIAKANIPESNYRFTVDAQRILTEKAGEMPLPEEFLKRFLKLRREQDEKQNVEVTDEEAQNMFKQLRWQLVKDHLAQALEIKVEKEDIDTAAFIFAQQQLSQYGIYNAPEDLIKQQAERFMQDDRARDAIQEHALDNKFYAAVKEAVKVNEKSISVEDFRKLYEKDEK